MKRYDWPRLPVSLFTDASCCQRRGVCGYAVWFKAVGKSERYDGVLRELTWDVTLAEMQAVAIGAWLIGKRYPGSEILATTDSEGTICGLDNRASHVPKRLATREAWGPTQARWRGILDEFDLVVRFRHIQAHTYGQAPRYEVNRWCDRASRAAMQAARATLAALPPPPIERAGRFVSDDVSSASCQREGSPA